MKDFLDRYSIFSKKLGNFQNQKNWTKNKFQVVITSYNSADWLSITLAEIEAAMDGKDWIMNFADDCSNDDTLKIVKKFSKNTTAKLYNIFEFDKADSVGAAKNRVIKEALEYKDEYDGIFLSDADDIFTKDRATYLPIAGKQYNMPILMGSWYYCRNSEAEFKPASLSMHQKTFGPWATLIHSSIIPDNGELFYNEASPYEDILLWDELFTYKIPIFAIDNVVSCYYNAGDGTASRVQDKEIKNKNWLNYQKLKHQLSSINV